MSGGLHDRLAAMRVEVAPAVGTAHLDAIRQALGEPATVPLRLPRLRRWVAALATALLGLGGAGVAVAAERAEPSEILYPVKRTTEWVRSWVDETVAAEHRLEELEAALARDAGPAVVMDRLEAARRTILGIDNAELRSRLDQVEARIAASQQQRLGDDSGPPSAGESPPPPATITTTPPEQRDAPDSTGPPSDRGGDSPSDEPPTSRDDLPSEDAPPGRDRSGAPDDGSQRGH